ncbi:DNA polymerase III subunit delta [Acidobacteriota bacterium]
MESKSPSVILKGLTPKKIKKTYLFYGTASLLIEQAIAKIETLLLDEETRAFNFNRFIGPDVDCAAVASSARVAPMMADRRLVVVKGFDPKKASSKKSLLTYLEDPCESTCLVVSWQAGADPPVSRGFRSAGRRRGDSKKKAQQWSDRFDEIVEFKLSKNETVAWILQRGNDLGLKLDRSAANQVFEILGENLGRIDNELEKLALSSDKAEGTGELVGLIKETRNRREWEIRQAVWDKDGRAVLSLTERLLDEGYGGIQLLSIMTYALSSVLKARLDLQQGTSARQAAADAGVVSFKQNDFAAMLQSVQIQDLTSAVEGLREIDQKLKATSADPRALLQTWVLSQKGLFGKGKADVTSTRRKARSRGW